MRFGRNGIELVLKTLQIPFLTDPMGLFSCQRGTCNGRLGEDSPKTRSLKDSTRNKREIWLAFRHRTLFHTTQSNDSKCSWFDVAQIEVKGQATNTVMLEIRSMEPIENT